jgi:hypothetical protein
MENAEFMKVICSKEQGALIVTDANCESRRLNNIKKFVSYLEENVPQFRHEKKPVKSVQEI